MKKKKPDNPPPPTAVHIIVVLKPILQFAKLKKFQCVSFSFSFFLAQNLGKKTHAKPNNPQGFSTKEKQTGQTGPKQNGQTEEQVWVPLHNSAYLLDQ